MEKLEGDQQNICKAGKGMEHMACWQKLGLACLDEVRQEGGLISAYNYWKGNSVWLKAL